MTRYSRQISLPEIGEGGQEKLHKARVLIVGAGGLGSPAALYLAGAGVGTIGLADDDTVGISNLQRQVLYTENEVGQLKVHCAAQRLRALNGNIEVNVYPFRLNRENARRLIADYDIVVDGCDNFSTRYLISDSCSALHKPYVYGAIQGFEGKSPYSVTVIGQDIQGFVSRRNRNIADARSRQFRHRRYSCRGRQCGSKRNAEAHLRLRRGFGRKTMDCRFKNHAIVRPFTVKYLGKHETDNNYPACIL